MIGAIAGDIIGSVYEYTPTKTLDFPLFSQDSELTDDTVLTVAVADCLLNKKDYVKTFRDYAHRYPHCGFGGGFAHWAISPDPKPYNSCGNGSAMRVSPIGFFHDSIKEVLREAKASAEVTHNHPEGIKGAQATAAAVFMARTGSSKPEIKDYVTKQFSYNLDRKLDDIRKTYEYDITSQGTVPESIIAFLEAKDYEDAIRKAISLGGDADTLACITGGIAQAFYKHIPIQVLMEARKRLTPDLLKIVDQFEKRCPDAAPILKGPGLS
jgi:ADP-ribosylglycohydrolase